MKFMANIFKISTILLIFMGGIIIGQTVQAKYVVNAGQLLEESAIEGKPLLVQEGDQIAVYFGGIQGETLNFIVCNYGESKLTEVSVMNMELDGQKADSYSYLGGIRSGEIKRCPIDYELPQNKETNALPEHIRGWLFVRGSQNYIHQKIDIDLSEK